MQEREHRVTKRKELGGVSVLALMMAAILLLSFVSFSQADPSATVRDNLADRLTTILSKLDQELGQLPAEKFPALKDQLDAISSLLNDLVSSLETPPGVDNEEATTKKQALKLDLMLHRLVIILERIANTADPTPTPGQSKVHETIADLRVWVNGYIAGVTAEMGPVEARHYEEMARALLTDLGEHVARIAAQAKPKAEESSCLEDIIEHIRVQLHLLDRFIVRRFGLRPRVPRLP